MPEFKKNRNNPQRRNQGVFLRTTGGGAAFQPSFTVTGDNNHTLTIAKVNGSTNLANYDYAKYKISDCSGNEVFGVFDDLGEQGVSVAGLYLSDELKIVITIKDKATGIVKDITGEYQFSNQTITLGAFIEAEILGERNAARTGGVVKLRVSTNQSFNINNLPEWASVKSTQLHGSQVVDITIAAGGGAVNQDITVEAAYGKLIEEINIGRL